MFLGTLADGWGNISLRPCPYPLWSIALAGALLTLPGCQINPGISKRSPADHELSEALTQAAVRGGTNGAALGKAARRLTSVQREGLQFLLENMPDQDLRDLPPPWLIENVTLAYGALAAAPWRDQVPKEIFFNEILPYACVSETRDRWRQSLRALCLPLIADCQTPAEAAQRLNQKLFKLVKVRYSTEREKADESPLEAMQSGLATCTGLSILLVDACRSVGVPARLVGTPMWTNLKGNHTWVEVWDGDWHFTGAAEPDPKGLDRGWFKQDASLARKNEPRHGIYASSFKKTALSFPLAWAPNVDWVSAVNVTDRYAPAPQAAGNSKVLVVLNGAPAFSIPRQMRYAPPPVSKPFNPADEKRLRKAVESFFVASTNKQATWKFSGALERLLEENEPGVRRVTWEAFRAAPIHKALKEDFDAHQVRFEKYRSPYTVKSVGARPTNGWALFIAMHGGGGAPKEVNDSQWKHMQSYYRDHPEAGGYLYVALRAPNDTWNGFYDTYVYPLIANLTRQFRLFADVDPNKIFLIGYSHGGYGAFAIGPKMPDQFAAIHASAAAPTEGETTPKTLRNTVFTCMVGEKDTMYGRYDRDKSFASSVEKLRGARDDIYPVRVDIIAGNGHTGLPDRDNIKGMYPAVRDPAPRELTWLQTDKVIRDFFWLHSDAPGKQREIKAVCRDNRVVVTASTNVTSASVLLDSRLIDFHKPVKLEVNGQIASRTLQPRLRVLCETLLRRGDPDLSFVAEIELPFGKAGTR
jgi:transglutaminase-like putative cysteine protease